MIQIVRAKPITTAQEVADIAGVDVSKATVIRRLAKSGLKTRRAARKFFIIVYTPKKD
ncbi:hypothetical protein DAPPUDRAFT_335366 [Daphnia pulex]|uniref:Transposase Tc1-like domain-containing protein n=1 Tax=Daphnia pulex TaxID=6669 RepID=E9HXL2_DAPPU|nr:hypothetical protein DAPPUDRAFT_335366 [Daphnia pulex]|eukprot:EFX63519.1 hypothetical protein DAPPUDRAFT_335366 [Daphnia pulex]